MDLPTLIVVHCAATWFMTGLIWVVQLVHYPLFDHADRARFTDFERAHSRRITWIVAPAMGLELLTGLGLLIALPAGADRGLALVGAALIGLTWLSTLCLQVPCHSKLAGGYDAAVHRRLVLGNWWRTATWSARSLLVAVLLLAQLD